MPANATMPAYLLTHNAAPFSYEGHENKFHHPHEHLICGNAVGNFLKQIIRSTQAKNILEIGTMIGFSTICMAKALGVDGKIESIELRTEDALRAQDNFVFFKVAEKIKIHIGDAKTIIPTLNKQWDVVFIDADKINYALYYEMVLPSVKKNGSIIFDNMLFHEKVLDANTNNKSAIAIQNLNGFLKADNRVQQSLFAIGDGLQWVIKN